MSSQSDPSASAARLYLPASLTACAGTWLEHAPDDAETARIAAAADAIRQQRQRAIAFYKDPAAARAFSIELFRDPAFAPLHLGDELIGKILGDVGEPPIVEDADDPAFAAYMRRATRRIANPRVRRDLAAQVRRFLPGYVEREAWEAAIATDSNAFRTALGNEMTPFLVQMTFGGLLRWYEQHDA